MDPWSRGNPKYRPRNVVRSHLSLCHSFRFATQPRSDMWWMPTWWWWCARTLTYQMSNFCPSPSLRVKQRSILGSPQLLSPGPHAVTGPAPAALMVPLRCFPTQRPAHSSDQGRKQQQCSETRGHRDQLIAQTRGVNSNSWDKWTDVKPWLWRGDGFYIEMRVWSCESVTPMVQCCESVTPLVQCCPRVTGAGWQLKLSQSLSIHL